MVKKAESVAAEPNAAEMRLVIVAREKDRVERDLKRVKEERDLSRCELVELEESFQILKQQLAEMSKERKVSDAKCKKLEEDAERMKEELRFVMREKDFLRRRHEDDKHLVEKLRRETEELKSQKGIDMDTLIAENKANASKVDVLEEELGDKKASLEDLKEENLSLVARYEESEKRYLRLDEDFNRNSIKYVRLEKEKLDLEKALDLKEKEMALQINELNEKMTMMEGEKNLFVIQISSLQAEISDIQSARKIQVEDAQSSCGEKIAMKESYCAEMQREKKNMKAEAIESLQMQLNKSLKNQHMMEITMEELQGKLNHLTAENEETKKQIEKNLETSNQGLQDVEKKLKDFEDSFGLVFALFKKIFAKVEERNQENNFNRENVVE